MRLPRWLAPLLAFAVAGCFGSSDDAGPDPSPTDPVVANDWAIRALPVGDGHDHLDPHDHLNLSTPNFEEVGWDPLITDYHGTTSGDYFCGEVADGAERQIAVTISFGTDVAVVLADVTDRAAPQKLGEYVLKRTEIYDAAITADGQFVALAASTKQDEQPDDARAVVPRLELEARNACTGEVWMQEEEVPFEGGVILLDVSDPLQPTFADYVPQPGLGVHSISSAEVDGTDYILASTTNLVHQASYFTIFTIESLPGLGTAKLQEYASYQAQYAGADAPDSGSALINGHVDGQIQKHPGTGEVLAYLANWDQGLIILRLDGPGRAVPVGVWNDHTADAGQTAALDFSKATGQIHEALPMDVLWDDRHYTFIGQEVASPPPGRSTGQVIMLDTTDPASPTPVARWTLPFQVEWAPEGLADRDALLFSTHYVEVIDRTLFVTLYHGGVWAVGTQPVAGTKELPTLGVFLPTNESPMPPAPGSTFIGFAPLVLDALALRTGELVIFDGMSGVYVLDYDPAVTVPVPDPWTRDSWID